MSDGAHKVKSDIEKKLVKHFFGACKNGFRASRCWLQLVRRASCKINFFLHPVNKRYFFLHLVSSAYFSVIQPLLLVPLGIWIVCPLTLAKIRIMKAILDEVK